MPTATRTYSGSKGEIIVSLPDSKQIDLLKEFFEKPSTTVQDLGEKAARMLLVEPNYSDFTDLYPAAVGRIGTRILRSCGWFHEIEELEDENEYDEATAAVVIEASKSFERLYVGRVRPEIGGDPLVFVFHEMAYQDLKDYRRSEHSIDGAARFVKQTAFAGPWERIQDLGMVGLYFALAGFIMKHEGAEEEFEAKKAGSGAK